MNLNQLTKMITNFKLQNSRKQLQHVYNVHWYQNFYLKSSWWKKVCNYYKKDYCEICMSSDSLHLHHKTYSNLYSENEEDLVTVCADCHSKLHGY